MNAVITAESSPAEARQGIRTGNWRGVTTGLCAGYVQANLVILPARLAAEFTEFCHANPRALPLLERTEPGVPDALRVAPGADLRTDLPRYRVYRDGVLESEVDTLAELWLDDLVAFLLGCSFTAEQRLASAGVRLRHLETGSNVPMFRTSMMCEPAGRFHGPVVVSMRTIARDEVPLAERVTAELPMAHGAPLHIGDPARIGIEDLCTPDWGDPLLPEPDEVPVFWACGVTPQAVIARVRPELALTHAPGHMFITDVTDDDVVGARPPLA
ncbi:MAG: putative hydro-lyase [Pseudonocardiaceae bacterium]|nr:putative hydro-lyase [Pseudonocardiaceae bacterium]